MFKVAELSFCTLLFLSLFEFWSTLFSISKKKFVDYTKTEQNQNKVSSISKAAQQNRFCSFWRVKLLKYLLYFVEGT